MEKLEYVVKNCTVHKDIMELVLTPVNDRIYFKPGQFVLLHFIEGGEWSELSRPYSVASSPLMDELRFYIKLIDGEFTSRLKNIKEKDKIGVVGPFGHMVLDEPSNLVMFGGGVGTAPFVSMLEHVLLQGLSGHYVLISSARTLDEAPWFSYLQELLGKVADELMSNDARIDLVQYVTREDGEDKEETLNPFATVHLLHRHIDNDLFAELVPDPEYYKMFICGSQNFASRCYNMGVGLGIQKAFVKQEAWG